MDASIFSISFAVSSRIPSFLNLADIADASAGCASQKKICQQTVSSTRSDGNRGRRTPRKNTPSGKLPERNDSNIPQTSTSKSSNSSNQEEIIALLRRIQSSISEDSPGTKRRSSNASKAKASAGSVLDILRQSRKQLEDDIPNKEGANESTRRRRAPTKEHRMHDTFQAADFRLTGQPSNFSRSPMPGPPGSTRTVEQTTADSSGRESAQGLPRVEEMKLTELKELAKSRGIKGYSKLRRSQLVDLLLT